MIPPDEPIAGEREIDACPVPPHLARLTPDDARRIARALRAAADA